MSLLSNCINVIVSLKQSVIKVNYTSQRIQNYNFLCVFCSCLVGTVITLVIVEPCFYIITLRLIIIFLFPGFVVSPSRNCNGASTEVQGYNKRLFSG